VSPIVAERILPLLLLASAKSTSMFDSTLPETPFLGQVHIWRANLCSSINFRVTNNSPGTRKIGSPIGSIGGSVIWQQLTSVGIDRTLMETRTTILRVEESIPVRAGQLTLRAGVSSDPPTVRVALEST
jgi:hypothetical protein